MTQYPLDASKKYIHFICRTPMQIRFYTSTNEEVYALTCSTSFDTFYNVQKFLGATYFTVTSKRFNFYETDYREYTEPQQEVNGYITSQEKNLFYGMRGNLENPKRIIFSFPSFAFASPDKKYPVSRFKRLTPTALSETLVVFFQDNYSTFGTYMLFDDDGNDLILDYVKCIRSILEQYNIQEQDAMFVGNSKGGTIAMLYASYFPNAHVVSVAGHSDIRTLFEYIPNARSYFLPYLKAKGKNDLLLKIKEAVNRLMKSESPVVRIYGSKDTGTRDEYFLKTRSNYQKFMMVAHHDVTLKSMEHVYIYLEIFCFPFEERTLGVSDVQVDSSKEGFVIRTKMEPLEWRMYHVFLDFINEEGHLEASTSFGYMHNREYLHTLMNLGKSPIPFDTFLSETQYKIRFRVYDKIRRIQYISNTTSLLPFQMNVIQKVEPMRLKVRSIYKYKSKMYSEFYVFFKDKVSLGKYLNCSITIHDPNTGMYFKVPAISEGKKGNERRVRPSTGTVFDIESEYVFETLHIHIHIEDTLTNIVYEGTLDMHVDDMILDTSVF